MQPEQAPVERHAEHPGHDADEQHQGKGLEGGRRIAAHREVGELPGEPPRDHHGADHGDQRAAIGRHRQRPPQLLEGEDEARERRIEHRGQPRARSAGHELPLRGSVAAAGGLAHGLGGAGAHLYRGAFEAEREPGADAEGAADELHGQESLPRHVAQPAQHRLDVGNAAARRIGREADGEPAGRAPDREAEERECHPPPVRMRVGAASRRASRTWSTPSIAQRKSTASPPARTPTAAARAISPGASCREGVVSARVSLGSFVGSTTSEILPDQVIADGQSLHAEAPSRSRGAQQSRNIGISLSAALAHGLPPLPPVGLQTSGRRRSNGPVRAGRRRDRDTHVDRDRRGLRARARTRAGCEREPTGADAW